MAATSFFRDDALLVAALVSWTADYDSEGTPAEWAKAIVNTKDDEESLVMFSIGGALWSATAWA
ncbi:hypothetical protein [Nannocystis punicea]|uniref:Uncharacterized protein n=1 Tax=Nannocystis punicea TaxID=2995304 RepID=A0ABY7HJF2_9BACT|nr:hypothetical protein [Nannocystis poenicansa]WAS99243.1 hypothetical protein O0S08_24205 [Nannocystis poenicansa]